MLANTYRLIAQIALIQGREDDATTATQRQQLFTDLFHERVPKQY